MTGMLIEGLLLLCWRSGSVHVRRDLLVEWLLFLLLWRVKRHDRRRLDTSNGNRLLRTRLVHWKLALPVFTECRFLRKRVVWHAVSRRYNRWTGRHSRTAGW